MKAIRKSDGKVIEVKEWRGASDVIYSEPDMNAFYQASDLDFSVNEAKKAEGDLRISVAKMMEILEDVASSQFVPRVLDDGTIDEIVNQVKKSI